MARLDAVVTITARGHGHNEAFGRNSAEFVSYGVLAHREPLLFPRDDGVPLMRDDDGRSEVSAS